MSQIVRFFENARAFMKIKEAFIDFISLDVKTAEIIIPEISNKLG
jgi:hypothetical protein